jgi:hypothetical protein
MGENWLHILDSSSTSDLTITTKEIVEIGDIVILEGKLSIDKDFGHGYLYPILLEDATVLPSK